MKVEKIIVQTSVGNTLSCYVSGPVDGKPILALHGLTATHRYVMMGSTLLQRQGFRLIQYDARGHGDSSPPPVKTAYSYTDLVVDAITVLDQLQLPCAAVVGSSMGAHTAIAMAQQYSERVSALGIITPAYDPTENISATPRLIWQNLASGLRRSGVAGFTDAFPFTQLATEWRKTVRKAIEQRLTYHRNLSVVADAIDAVSQAKPFSSLQLPQVPTLIIASRDEADPFHPLQLAQQYHNAIATSTFCVEAPGQPPLAWSGGGVAKAILDLLKH